MFFIPDSGRITVELLAEKGSGRLLGGQIVGAEGLGVERMINLALSYAPPFSIPRDPVVIAARNLAKLLSPKASERAFDGQPEPGGL